MWMMNSEKWKVAQGLWVIPAITAWVDVFTKSQIWETTWQVAWVINWILNYIPEPIKSLAVPATWVISAWLLSNQVMNDLGIQNKWIKYWVNGLSMLGWYAAWTAVAPYLAGASIAYWAWKHGWKFGKEAITRLWKWTLNVAMNTLAAPVKAVIDIWKSAYRGVINSEIVKPKF